MSQFTCGKHNYKAGVIDARAQFHIVRRLAPFFSAFAGADVKFSKNMKPEDFVKAVPVLANALASMSDADADYVLFGLMACVVREQEQGLGWAPVSKGTNLMFHDISMPEMVTLAGRALAANLGDFFGVLNSLSSQAGQKPNGQ